MNFKKVTKYVILLLSLFIFILITINILNNNIILLDTYCYNLISKYLINTSLTNYFKVITYLGNALVLIILSIFLIIMIKNKKDKMYIPLNLMIISLINKVLKLIFKRPRPNINRLIKISGYSFPSGHAMISMAFYGYLIYLIYKNIKNKYLKNILIFLLSILILLIGLSRVYLGVHYTSDVLAGYFFSLAYLIIYISVVKKKVL